MLKKMLVLVIKSYQYAISPLFGNCCRFTPSCSEYAIQALLQHGTFRALGLIICRVLKCHPWHEGGPDLVPEQSRQEQKIKNLSDETL